AMVIRSLATEPGARVLELGVGTGLSLDAYPTHCHVTGVDLAPDMLERAQDNVNRNGWRHIALEQGDALDLKSASDSFDYVMAFHVVSVVPDPVRMMTEARRVCRPGGVITIINHFRSANPTIARFMRTIDPLTRRGGWSTPPPPAPADPPGAPARPPGEDVAAVALHDRRRAQRQGAAGGPPAGDATARLDGARRSVVRLPHLEAQ